MATPDGTSRHGYGIRLEWNRERFVKTMNDLAALSTSGQQLIAAELDALASDWQNEIALHMPVESGLARGGVKVAAAEVYAGVIRAEVGTNLDYVTLLEFGTSRIARGRVMGWQPGDPPITDWPAKNGGAENPSGNKRATARRGDHAEFMPPFRGSWPLVANRGLGRLKTRLKELCERI